MRFEKFENSNVPQRGQPLAADPDRWHTHRRMFRSPWRSNTTADSWFSDHP